MSEKGILRSFPRTFWVANVMELFERAAYYGLNSVLAIYLTARTGAGGLGFAEESVGFLQSIVYALTYVIPILGGALAEKFGYRRMLIAAFCLLGTGYIVAGHMTVYPLVFTALAVMAFGAGLFKPIISGTIARTTSEKNSGFGFGIYYWMINLGAFLAPIVVSKLRGMSWRYVFLASGLYVLLMLLPAIFLFRDPELPGKGITLRQSARNALLVLSDARFMLMIFIYSFFWILYFQQFGSILWYLRDFVDRAPVNEWARGVSLFGWRVFGADFTFGEEFVTTINAGTIILLQVFISRLVRNWRAIPTMSSGMVVGTAGFLILALSRSPWLFILGMVVFSVGEMTAHPKYYSYVGIVAPQDRKAVYMGYAFLYGVIGSLFGNSAGAVLYARLARAGNPRLFFVIFFFLGLLGFAGLLLFNRFFAHDTPQANRRARGIVVGIYALLLLAGAWLLGSNLLPWSGSYRVVVQAAILLLVGAGGLLVTLRHGRGETPGA